MVDSEHSLHQCPQKKVSFIPMDQKQMGICNRLDSAVNQSWMGGTKVCCTRRHQFLLPWFLFLDSAVYANGNIPKGEHAVMSTNTEWIWGPFSPQSDRRGRFTSPGQSHGVCWAFIDLCCLCLPRLLVDAGERAHWGQLTPGASWMCF